MNLKQFTEYCYEDVAAEMGFLQCRGRYIRVGDGFVSTFTLGKWSNNRVVRPMMDIFPLCRELHLTDEEKLDDPTGGYWRHYKRREELDFSQNTPIERCEEIKTYLLDVFDKAQRPFLEQARDLPSTFDAYRAYIAYQREFALGKVYDFEQAENYWMFLIMLKRYDEALENFNKAAQHFGWNWDDLEEGPYSFQMALIHRRLENGEWDKVEAFVRRRTDRNQALLGYEKMIKPGK